MKTLTFVRHYILTPPFDSLANMSYDDYKGLSEGTADPAITETGLVECIHSKLQNNFYKIVISGTSKRTQKTGEVIKNLFAINENIIRNEMFNEIPSVILNPISDSEFQERKLIGKLGIKKTRILDSKETYKRLLKIDNFLRKLPYDKILVVSSSYLIGQLNYYYNHFDKRAGSYDAKAASKYEIGGYLDGFTIQLIQD